MAGVAGVAMLAAIWLPAELPMTDLPEHRAIARAVRELRGLGAFDRYVDYAPWYRDRGPAALYGATYYGAAAATDEPDGAARVELTLALLAWIAGAIALARRSGASARVASLAAPLLFCLSYFWGFLPFLLGAPALLWAPWAALELRESGGTGRRRTGLWMLVLGVLALAALTHPATAFLATLAAVIALAPGRFSGRRIGRWAAAAAAAGAAPALVFAVQALGGRPNAPEPAQPTRWSDFGERIQSLVDWAAPGAHFALGVAFLCTLAALAAIEIARGRREAAATEEDSDRRANRRRIAILAAAVAAAALVLPHHSADLHFAGERLGPLAIAVALALPRGAAGAPAHRSRLLDIASLGLWLAGAGLAVAIGATTTTASLRFSDEVGNIDRISELIRRGSRVLAIPVDVRSDAIARDVPPHLHTASRVVENRGGIVSIPPLTNVGMPVELTDRGLRALVVPERGEGRVEAMRARITDWDYVLVYARGGFPALELEPLAPYLEAIIPPEHAGGPYAGPWYLLRVGGGGPTGPR